MNQKPFASLARKVMYGIVLLGMFFPVFSGGSLSSLHAQDIATATPLTPEATITSSNSLVDTFWNGYNAGRWILPEDQQPYVAFTDQMDTFGIIWAGFLEASNHQVLQIPSIPIPAILGQDGEWLLSYPGESDYEDMLLQMPHDLIPSSVLAEFIPHLGAQTAVNAGYYPWHGSMKVTQDRQNPGGSHYPGGPDEWAWDFGNGTSGWPVYASRGGRIAWIDTSHETNSGCSSCDWTTANVIVIDFGDGYAAIYMHLAKEWPQRFSINQPVNTGDLIGYADQTGRTSGPHLHFAIQGWDSSWNGNSSPSIWYRHSQESLFNDETPYANPGNPTYPNWYTSHIPSGGSSSCNPTADQVALYVDANYSGTCVVKGIGDYPNPSSLGIANDSVSSVRVGSNVKLILCRDDNYGGTCETFQGDDPNLSDNSIGNDQVSSAKVQSRSGGSCGITSIPSGYNQCAEEGGFCSFSGTANVIYGANSCYTSPRSFSNGTACNNDVFGDPLPGVHKYCYTNGSGGGGSWAYQLFDLGDYNGDKYESNQTITDLSTVGWNDRAESIKINSGYEIIACEHANFQGNCGRATGPAQFSDINALAQGLRNGLSSIKVCAGSCPNPPSANFDASPQSGTAPLVTTFHIVDTSNITSCSWNYGDGQTGTSCASYHTHTYTNAGTYTVSLTVSGPGGSNSMTRTNYITVTNPSSNNWHVEYFNSKDLNNRCYDGYEYSTYIFKNWGSGSPASGCNSDNFSARFTRNFNFSGGYYSFHCQHDDGCRIFIDGQEKLNAWWDSNFTGHDWGGSLSGNHEVKIEFYDSGGDARLEAFWSGPGFLPTGQSCTSGEWCARYFGNKDLAGTPAVQRNEGTANINYIWNDGGIGYGFPVDNFSARWERNVYFAAGRYRFHIKVDDGGRLWVNNNLVINQWKDQGATEYTADVNLSTGTIPLKFEYYENGGGAIAQMWWDILETYSVPPTPTNFRVASTTTNSITLAWDDVSGETGYKIYKWGYDGSQWTFIYYASVGANVTTYTDNNLPCGNDFNFYELSAYNAYGESDHAGWIQGVTDACPPPVNDDFSTPQVISQLPYTDTLSTTGATAASDDPPFTTCNRQPGLATVWYRYVPASSGGVQIDTFGSDYDTVLGVWTGSRGSLTPIGCNDNSDSTYQSKVRVSLTAGTTYYIEVAQYNGSLSMTQQSIKELLSAQENELPPGASGISAQSVGGTLKLNVVPTETLTLSSAGAQDGWILESTETSNTGGSSNVTDTTFNLGDDASDRQFRAILSFNTASLPDTATITAVTLQIKRQGIVGTNPFLTHGKILVDIRSGPFGTALLQLTDFNAAAGKNNVAQFSNTPLAGNWYSVNLNPTAFAFVNKTGITQFRLRFFKDDNDDMGADYLKFFSGDATAAYRPVLIIQYIP